MARHLSQTVAEGGDLLISGDGLFLTDELPGGDGSSARVKYIVFNMCFALLAVLPLFE